MKQGVDIYKSIVPNRADLILKFLYIDAFLKQENFEYISELYKKHIKFYAIKLETHKNNIEKYEREFQTLILSIQERGYLNDGNEILFTQKEDDIFIFDGIHRLACCLYFGHIPKFKNIEIESYPVWGFEWFLDNGFSQVDILQLLYGWSKMDKDIIPIFLWNQITDISLAKNIFLDEGTEILKHIDLNFSPIFYSEFIEDIYSYEIDDGKNIGIDNKITTLLKDKGQIRIFIGKIKKLPYANLISLKKRVRKIMISSFNISDSNYYYTYHAPDNVQEKNYIFELFRNYNIDLIFNRNYNSAKNFLSNFTLLKKKLVEKNINPVDICVVKSGPLSLIGLHDSFDIDIIFKDYGDNGVIKLEEGLITLEVLDYQYHPTITNKDIIYNDTNHFYFKGIKFITLELLLEVKGYYASCEKDMSHAKKLKNFLKYKNYNKKNFSFYVRSYISEGRLIKRKIQLGILNFLAVFSEKLGVYDQMFHIWTKYIKKKW